VTRDQHLEVLRRYQDQLKGWETERSSLDAHTPPGMSRGVRHANWMVNEMLRRMETGEDKPGQADRWLGFIQGVLWDKGFFSINELIEHNTTELPHDEP